MSLISNSVEFLINYIGAPNYLIFVVLSTIKIFMVLVPLILVVAYFTYAERKIIGYIQSRVGPNRV